MGELFRRYWHPVAASSELVDHPTKCVKILEKLGESDQGIILYRKPLKEQLAKMRRGEDPMKCFSRRNQEHLH